MMFEVSQSFEWGCSVSLGVLASMYPIPVRWMLSKKWSSLTMFFSVFSPGWVACRVAWVVGG